MFLSNTLIINTITQDHFLRDGRKNSKSQIKYCSKINCKQRTIMPQKGKFEN